MIFPPGHVSGLVEAIKVVRAIEGVAVVWFDERDVVRHPLVRAIVKAYEVFSNAADGSGSPRDSSRADGLPDRHGH